MINDLNYQVLTETQEQENLAIKIKWHQKVYYFFKCVMDVFIALIAFMVLIILRLLQQRYLCPHLL